MTEKVLTDMLHHDQTKSRKKITSHGLHLVMEVLMLVLQVWLMVIKKVESMCTEY